MFFKRYQVFYTSLWISLALCCITSAYQAGPDPWNYENSDITKNLKYNEEVPPDLRISPKRKTEFDSKLGNGEYFFRRLLSIVLKGGQVKQNEDDSIDVSLQLNIDQENLETLSGYLRSNNAFSEDMYRRCLGLLEEAIYQPSIVDKLSMTWSDYVQVYLSEYKTEITLTLALLAGAVGMFWLSKRLTHRHLVLFILLALYVYEVFVSYKEAEQKEVDIFIKAINSCKWYKWSECEAPKPDPLIFLKHMNPLKIGIRMLTTFVSEPLVTLSHTFKIVIDGMTDELWFPFNKIVYGTLMLIFNVMLMFLLITILFNFIFNIPIDLGYLGISIGLKQRHRTVIPEPSRVENDQTETKHINYEDKKDRISGDTLHRFLNICERALISHHDNSQNLNQLPSGSNKNSSLRRTASTGRISDLAPERDLLVLPDLRQRKNYLDGSGDAR